MERGSGQNFFPESKPYVSIFSECMSGKVQIGQPTSALHVPLAGHGLRCPKNLEIEEKIMSSENEDKYIIVDMEEKTKRW